MIPWFPGSLEYIDEAAPILLLTNREYSSSSGWSKNEWLNRRVKPELLGAVLEGGDNEVDCIFDLKLGNPEISS